MVNNSQEIANAFIDYFSTIADTIIDNIREDHEESQEDISHSSYLINNFNNAFPNIIWKYALTYEISKIVELLNSKNSCGYNETQ